MKLLSTLIVASMVAVSASTNKNKQCYGHTPMPSVSSYLGASINYETSERICCNNHRFAEYAGYLEAPEVDLFSRLDPNNETVFYDSVCGLPLFIAPRGRTFEDFKKESLKHGWPSFRPEEIVSENVIIHPGGRMESRCLTHLGHNLPEGGMDRYCIDLVCIAGQPLDENDERFGILQLLDGAVVTHDEFNVSSYQSSAESFSGNYSDGTMLLIIALSVGAGILGVPFCCFVIRPMLGSNKKNMDENTKDATDEKAQKVKYEGIGVTERSDDGNKN